MNSCKWCHQIALMLFFVSCSVNEGASVDEYLDSEIKNGWDVVYFTGDPNFKGYMFSGIAWQYAPGEFNDPKITYKDKTLIVPVESFYSDKSEYAVYIFIRNDSQPEICVLANDRGKDP